MPNGYMIQVPDFRAETPEAISTAVDNVVKSQRDIVTNILRQLRDGGLSDEKKVYAIYVLGELRAAEAVTILIGNIDLKAVKVDSKGAIGRWGMYPAQEALAKIGLPAVNMILEKLESEESEIRRELMCAVIADAVGKKAGYAILRLRQEEQQDPSRRSNLERAMRLLL